MDNNKRIAFTGQKQRFLTAFQKTLRNASIRRLIKHKGLHFALGAAKRKTKNLVDKYCQSY